MSNLLSDAYDDDLAAPSPFTPSFGVPPNLLVGRDASKREMLSGLHNGPMDKRFVSVLLGARGSGKTVMLDECEDAAAASGWLVISVNATTEGLLDRIKSEASLAHNAHPILPDAPTRQTRSNRRGLRLGPAWFENETQHILSADWSLRRWLTTLGQHALANRTAVLVTVDELHAADREEMRSLCADIQHITQRKQLPVAVLAAGLGELQEILARDKKLSFFLRSHQVHLPPISAAQARGFYQTMYADADAGIDTEALDYMAVNTGPLPIRMQSIGDAAWESASSGRRPVTLDIAKFAVAQTDTFMDSHVFTQVWHDHSREEHLCLAVLADRNGTATFDEIAAGSGLPKHRARIATDLLAMNECITQDPRGVITFGPAMSIRVAQWGRQRIPTAEQITGAAMASEAPVSSGTSRSAGGDKPRCGHMMVRAGVRCVLAAGHSGPHRSRLR